MEGYSEAREPQMHQSVAVLKVYENTANNKYINAKKEKVCVAPASKNDAKRLLGKILWQTV